MSDERDDRPTILNPEAVGDPNQTPVVQLPAGLAAHFERTRCPECRQINWTHAEGCDRVVRDPETRPTLADNKRPTIRTSHGETP